MQDTKSLYSKKRGVKNKHVLLSRFKPSTKGRYRDWNFLSSLKSFPFFFRKIETRKGKRTSRVAQMEENIRLTISKVLSELAFIRPINENIVIGK